MLCSTPTSLYFVSSEAIHCLGESVRSISGSNYVKPNPRNHRRQDPNQTHSTQHFTGTVDFYIQLVHNRSTTGRQQHLSKLKNETKTLVDISSTNTTPYEFDITYEEGKRMSKMRWADSDSDSEEEYVPPPQPDPDPEPEPEPVDHYIPPTPSSPRGGRGGWNSYGSPGGFSQLKNALPHNHHHQSSNNANQWRGGGGGQGRPYGSSGGGRPGSGNRSQSLPVDRGSPDGGGHPRDWKQMAKAASRHPAGMLFLFWISLLLSAFF